MSTLLVFFLVLNSQVNPTQTPIKTKSTKIIINKNTVYSKQIQTKTKLPKPGILPFLGALIPGILYPAGHLVMGDKKGHLRIIGLKGCGLGLIILGAIPLFLTNASPKVIHLPIYSILSGFSLFSISTFADIYGSLFSGSPTGTPSTIIPRWEISTGYRYIDDYLIDNTHNTILSTRFNYKKFNVNFNGSLTTPSSNWKINLSGGYRFFDSTPKSGDGSFLESSAGFTWRRYKTEKFSTLTSELFIHGRMDMHHISASLRGSFAEIGAGAALRFVGYDTLGNNYAEDWEVIPLFRFAFGVYFGKGEGEFKLIYDHRHDDELGGLAMGGSGGDGVIGHFGMEGTWWFTRQFGVTAEIAAGSSYLYSISFRMRELK
jgi:hypothetical protein